MSFGRGGQYSPDHNEKTEKIHGRVTQIKASPEKGKKRLIVKSKTGMRKAVGVDVEAKNASHIKRKEDYTLIVKEKDEHNYSGRPKASGFKTYSTDEKPEIYRREPESGFKDFGANSRMKNSNSRTRF